MNAGLEEGQCALGAKLPVLLVGGREPMGPEGLEFHRQLLGVAAEARSILHVPAARRDAPSRQAAFRDAYEKNLGCKVSTLELHHRRPSVAEIEALFAGADLVFLDGGNTSWLVECLRRYRLTPLLRTYVDGPRWLLGFSAGANCFHEWGWSAVGGRQRPVQGLGILPGGFAPHGSDPDRESALRRHLVDHSGRWLVCGDGSAIILQSGDYRALGDGLRLMEHRDGRVREFALKPGESGPYPVEFSVP